MKKQYLLLLLLFLGIKLNAQTCNFTYATNPGSTLVSFSPSSTFSPNIYHFVWNFGDGNTSTQAYPVHAYNVVLPVVACYDVYDSANTLICSACDSIVLQSSFNCFYSYQNVNANTFIFTSQGSSGGLISWDFGDGTTGTGNPVTHVYAANGQYIVNMTLTDSLTGNILCQYTQAFSVNTTSNCSFTASSGPSSPTTFGFGAIVSPGSIVTWDFGDNTTDSGMQVSHTYSTPGIYLACMYATDMFGVSCQYCQPIQVGNPGNCNYTFVPDPNNPNSYTFAASLAYPNTNAGWDFGDGSTGNGSTITHIFTQPGTYQVCMLERDSAGLIVSTSCNYITIIPTSNCAFTSLVDSLSPLTIDFQVNSGAGASVAWDFGDGSTGTGFTPQHTYNSPGVYQVCISVGAGGSIICTYCDYVQVGAPGQCAISYYPDPFNPNTFNFNSSVNSATSVINWTFGDGFSGTGQSLTHTYANPGTYTVCITEWNVLQQVVCQSCITITVSGGGPSNCQASFLGVANGLDAFFIDMSLINSTPVTYSWDFGDNSISTQQFPQHTYSTPGTYTVCLTIATANCSDTYCSAIVVDTLTQNPSNGCNAFYATVQLAPYQVSIVNLSSGLNLSFDWDFGDGSAHDTSPYPSHYYTSTGSYNLCLTVSDGNGCSSSFCDTINVDTLGYIYRTSVQGFTINVLSPQQLTGVNEVKAQKSFRAYPNPVTSELYVAVISGNEKAKEFRILSFQGSEVLAGKLSGLEGRINTQSLSSGSYLLEITLTDGSRSYQSIIKE